MGASRESFHYKINPKALFRWHTWRYNRKLLFEDNFMPIVCKMFGHISYDCSEGCEAPELACRRCHRYLPITK